ncbi:MAG TPA: ABC transporter permease [Candidatus Dormibacteraeota bacterium]|nr:ABC transporter permease [Candidatus Dormibacteraeota bacterium]
MSARVQAFESRRVPPLGGFNLTFLYLEIRRLLRNRRTLLFTLILPLVFFFLFKSNKRIESSGGPEIAASTMIGVAVYGAMIAATSGGAMVSVERALGWSRQLRLTPLRPPAYVAIKLLTAMFLGLLSVSAVVVAGAVSGVQMDTRTLLLSALLAWVGAFVFAAFGLFMGYMLPSENVMQIISPVLAVFAFFGGLFIPVSLLPSAIQDLAPYMPTYGVAQIARYPLLGGSFDWTWILGAVLWTLAFAAGAMVLFRRDTRRT